MDDDDLLAALEAAGTGEPERSVRRSLTMEDFRFDETQIKYWDLTTGRLLEAKAVDGAVKPWPAGPPNDDGSEGRPVPPSNAINDVRTGLTVEGATWWPGRPQIIDDIVMTPTGPMDIVGARCYNLYSEKPRREPPEGVTAERWIEHVKRLWPDPIEHEHFFDYCAHIVQRPDEKVNHGVVLSGGQGIGKDSAIHPIREGIGNNAVDVTPDIIISQWNGYAKSVVVIINEVRPHAEDHKSANFYNVLKPLLAAPPTLIAMSVKYQNMIHIQNLCHVFLTTNDALTMYIPPEDRRLFVMSSILPGVEAATEGDPEYFPDLYRYFNGGGVDAVMKWLDERLLDGFNPTAPPPMTGGKEAIINSAESVRRSLADEIIEGYLECVGDGERSEVIFPKDLLDFIIRSDLFDDAAKATGAVKAKNFHYKMAEAGWDQVRNPYANEWRAGKYRSRNAFIRSTWPRDDRINRVEDELKGREADL